MPSLGAAEDCDTDVPAEFEDIAFEVDVAFVAFAGLGVIEAATSGCRIACDGEIAADLQVAEGASAEGCVRVVLVQGAGGGGGDGHDFDAEGLPAREGAYNGAIGCLPVAEEPGGSGGETERKEQEGDQASELQVTHAGLDAVDQGAG